MSEYVIICTTVETTRQAEQLARDTVERRLAACVQLTPIQSIYRWQDTIENANEIRLTLKTTNERKEELIETIRQQHPYETPEIIVLPLRDGHAPYLSWIREAVSRT